MVGGAAAFKRHAAFGFWRQDVLPDPERPFRTRGPMGAKITGVLELPPDEVLLGYIRRAVELNERGAAPRARSKARPKPTPAVPPVLKAALRKNRKALAAFEGFPPSHRREYIEWITEAKREETRRRRLATILEWLSQGKPRHWKYVKR